jgi:4-amino-4-deoxy-L-arabinose transferase-like glycosyltransferase
LNQFSEWRKGLGVIILILLLALLSRTVNLSSFPYFQSNWPWNLPSYGRSGLYSDEYFNSLRTVWDVYYPFLQVVLVNIATSILGYSIFSVRLVPALFSSITCVLVYLSAYELFNRRLSAFLSSLFFIFMTPALVFGRMDFMENGAATLFVAAFFFAIKYLRTSKNYWLASAGVAAGLSFLCKQTGIAAAIFLILLISIYKPKAIRQLIWAILLVGVISSLYFVQILVVNPAYIGNGLIANISVGVGSTSWLAVFLENLMPSGVNVMWIESNLILYKDLFRLVSLDFWYIFAFFIIIYLISRERESVREIVLALVSYVLVLLLVGHANSYYVILAQPFMAIPVGYGVSKLQDMSGAFSCIFSLLLCLPAASYISYYMGYFMVDPAMDTFLLAAQFIIVTPIVIALAIKFWLERKKHARHGIVERILLIYYTVWIVGVSYILIAFHSNIASTSIQFVAATPIALIGIVRLIYEKIPQQEAVKINKLFIVFYIGCLITGSYLLPVFYPGYFAQSSVPI